MTGRPGPAEAGDDVRQVAAVNGAEYALRATRPDPEAPGRTLYGLAVVGSPRLWWVPAGACSYVGTWTPAGWVWEAPRPTD